MVLETVLSMLIPTVRGPGAHIWDMEAAEALFLDKNHMIIMAAVVREWIMDPLGAVMLEEFTLQAMEAATSLADQMLAAVLTHLCMLIAAWVEVDTWEVAVLVHTTRWFI